MGSKLSRRISVLLLVMFAVNVVYIPFLMASDCFAAVDVDCPIPMAYCDVQMNSSQCSEADYYSNIDKFYNSQLSLTQHNQPDGNAACYAPCECWWSTITGECLCDLETLGTYTSAPKYRSAACP